MKKFFLIFMMLIAATATMAAQDELEQTAAPYITVEMPDAGMAIVTIVNADEDPGAEIYYDFAIDGSDYYGWTQYIGEPFMFTEIGTYYLRAFAQSPDKAPSDMSEIWFTITPLYTHPYSFIVDGIYYSIQSDHEVWVCAEELEEEPYSGLPYSTHNAYPCYSDEVVIPGSVDYEGETYAVTGIALCAFEYCDVTRVILPNTIAYIDDHAFGNSKITEITIPASVTLIGHFAFYACRNLKKIVCMGTVPPEFAPGYSNQAIALIDRNAALFVPLESLEAYKAHVIWNQLRIVPFIGAGPGDIDGSGGIDVDDVTNIIDMILTGTVPEYADVNGDGLIDIDDITVILNMLLNGH